MFSRRIDPTPQNHFIINEYKKISINTKKYSAPRGFEPLTIWFPPAPLKPGALPLSGAPIIIIDRLSFIYFIVIKMIIGLFNSELRC